MEDAAERAPDPAPPEQQTPTRGHNGSAAETQDGGPERLARAVEALIFASDEPVAPARLAEVFAEVTSHAAPGEERVAAAVTRLNDAYAADGRSFRIEEWGGGYQMATREEWAPFVKTLLAGPRQQSLSRSLSETLAVVAYRQPVTRPEVDFIRGVSADYALRKLMELELVDVEGRSDSLGRPLLYGTTAHFLEEFGLASLGDLPTLREVEELLDDPNFNEERAKLLQLRRREDGAASGAKNEGATQPGEAPQNEPSGLPAESPSESPNEPEAQAPPPES